jgi:Sodium/hydrogen exchanger family
LISVLGCWSDARDLRRRAWPRVRACDIRRRADHRNVRGRYLGRTVGDRHSGPAGLVPGDRRGAPTDAVAVEGLLSRVRLPPGLRAIIAGESLFNDGAAVVLFGAAVALVAGGTDMARHGRLAAAILVECTGGAALGATAGYLTFRVIRFTREDFLRLTISLALVLLTYRGAVELGISGPVAVVTAGLVFNYRLARRRRKSTRARIFPGSGR